MKKKIIIISVSLILALLLSVGGYFLYRDYKIKHAVISVELKDNLETEFLSDVKVSDFITSINGKIIQDKKINTTKVGTKEVKFKYINDDNIKVEYSYKIEVLDKTAPVIWMGSSYSIKKGSTLNILDKVLCGDNYDNNPKCEIIGEYDTNKEGVYPLTFKATDSSNNITKKEFNLYVKGSSNKPSKPIKPTPKPKTLFSDVIKNYKKENTEIGVDLSEWQGTVDFDKLKNAGVEFVILRVGGTKGIKGDYFLDGKFKENIEKANKIGMPVGIYFYSYANSKEKAIKDAKWILKQIKNYKIDLPIAFDWENWSFYNEFNLSFFNLTDMAEGFLDVFKNAGYEGMLYSSKSYLESIWMDTDYPVWLAHYAKSTSYKGDFKYWQICNNGRVDGINGDVDINIRYK